MIRDFVWDDYADVVRLWQAVGSGVLTESDLRSALDHGPDLLLLAEVEGAGVVGVVFGTFDGRRGWIHRLAVHPNHRREGLARALVERLEQRLHALGAPRINLLVLPDNETGLAFWKRMGYLRHPDVLCTKDAPHAAPPGVR